MLWLICAIVSLIASAIGAICGIGGGVIIKPVLDATGMTAPAAASLLSSCTVLAMAVISLIRRYAGGAPKVEMRQTLPLALGAVAGGFMGAWAFGLFARAYGQTVAGISQNALLLVATAATLAYILNKDKVKSKTVTNAFLCAAIGLALGACSAFMGIGGGPFNLAVLFYFFSMQQSKAATNSLFIIALSQTSGLIKTIFLNSAPVAVNPWLLITMVGCGVLGGVLGSMLYKKLAGKWTQRLLNALMCLIMLICTYNIIMALRH